MNYDSDSKVLTAMMELPGVKKSDVRVTLSTCVYNRVKQITVFGLSRPSFDPYVLPSGADLTVRERKFGEFTRTFAVPSDIKVRSHSRASNLLSFLMVFCFLWSIVPTA